MIRKVSLIFVCAIMSFVISAQNKHALLLAVGDYPDDIKYPWSDISSLNDLELIYPMLERQKFPKENITELTDAKVTVENVNVAFDELTSKLEKGDMVYFHYSGHGQQVEDLNGDEEDGYDEALVFYDAPMRWYQGYTFDKHYVDDQLKIKIDAIRNKIGSTGQVIVTIDACHSGTATRGENETKVRGSGVPCVSPDFKAKSETKKGSFGTDFEYEKDGQLYAFFGCRSNQVNREVMIGRKGYGSLTYFLVQGMEKLEENASYTNLLSQINRSMVVAFNNQQHPQMEASNPNQLIFGGGESFVHNDPYFTTKNNVYSEGTIEISAGFLNGISEGDKLGLYDVSVTNPKGNEPLATVEIIEVDSPIKSKGYILQTNNNLSVEGVNYRLFKTYDNGTGEPLKVKIDVANKKAYNLLKKGVSQIENIQFVESGYNYLIKEDLELKKTYSIYLGSDSEEKYKNQQGREVKKTEDVDFFVERLMEANKIDFFRKLDNINDPTLGFRIGFQEVKFENGEITWESDTILTDLSSVSKDQKFLLYFENTGTNRINVSILNIKKDYTIEYIPHIFFNNANHIILNPGEKKKATGIGWEKDLLGLDQYLFIATAEPVDLTPILALGKPIATRGGNDPFTDFLNANSSGKKTRGGWGVSGATVKSINIMVEEKNNLD